MPLPKTLPTSNGENPSSQQSSRSERVLGNRYKVERRLGSGNFGVAQLVKDLKAGGELKVLKELPMRDVEPGETVDAVREARLLSKLDHPNIVKFHDSFADGDCFCIVTEYCEGGDLDDKIKKWRQSHCEFDEQLILSWFVQLAMAIQYLHERRVLHRDLKARNIFLKNNMIKLGDFGISRILMGTSEYATTFAGTPYYMSPEVLKRENYNSKSDIWSLGVVLYELCCLQHAFHGKSFMDVLNGIVHGKTPQLPKKFHPNLQSLFQWMLNKDPQKRPSAVELLRDPFISSHLQDLLSKMTHKSKSTTAESDAREILHALGPDRRSRKTRSPPAEKTPRQQLLERKQQKAEEEAERRK
jgi:NIMA (never in mitosis gene a)-related kinase